MSRRSENENMIRCRFFGTPGGCAHGQQCHFVHIARQLAPTAPAHLMDHTMPYIHRTLPHQRRRVIGDEYFFSDAERSHMRAERNARIAAQHVEQAAAAEVPDPSVEAAAPDPVVEASPPPPSAEPARSRASDNRHRRHRRGRHLSRRERSRRRERRRTEHRQSESRDSEHRTRRSTRNESSRHRSNNMSSTYAFDAALNILREIAMNSRPVDNNSDHR